jgi:hypothetical protein
LVGDFLVVGGRNVADDLGLGVSSKTVSFGKVMTLYDEAFVKAAYILVLGRKADPIGLEYYAGRLRGGHSRISVLDQLTKSAEAIDAWKSQPGLADAIRRFRASRRLSGWKLALTDPELGRTAAIRRARALQNSIASQRNQLEESLAKLSEQHDVVKHMVSELGKGQAWLDEDPSMQRDLGRRQTSILPQLRSRRLEEIRSFDLPPAAREILNSLRF